MVVDQCHGFLRIAVTPSRPLCQEGRAIAQLFEDDIVDIVHIRHPELSHDETAEIIISIPEEYYPRLTLHDHHTLCLDYPVGGIHLNHRNPSISTEILNSGRNLRVSRSCHSLEELDTTEGLTYVTLSPIFDSISKTGYSSSFPESSWPDLKNAISLSPTPVIALGGVTPGKIPDIKKLGFAGYAMLGALWNNSLAADPRKRKKII